MGLQQLPVPRLPSRVSVHPSAQTLHLPSPHTPPPKTKEPRSLGTRQNSCTSLTRMAYCERALIQSQASFGSQPCPFPLTSITKSRSFVVMYWSKPFPTVSAL